jgi:hypothetical protein
MWENLDLAPFPEIWMATRREADGEAPYCAGGFQADELVTYVCTRGWRHPGRHIARTTFCLAAAWPGDHEPTMEDLL